MAHYAKVKDGVVTQVIVAEAEFFDTFIDTDPGEWIQTSYNTHGGVHYDPTTGQPSSDQSLALRKNFAGVGGTYDLENDAFIPPRTYDSWVVNPTTFTWEAPIPYPTDGLNYNWDEDVYQADNTTGWVLVE